MKTVLYIIAGIAILFAIKGMREAWLQHRANMERFSRSEISRLTDDEGGAE